MLGSGTHAAGQAEPGHGMAVEDGGYFSRKRGLGGGGGGGGGEGSFSFYKAVG